MFTVFNEKGNEVAIIKDTSTLYKILNHFRQWTFKKVEHRAHKNAKLTLEDVRLIRQLKNNGHTLQSIADRFNVTRQAIHKIVTRQTWKNRD